MPLGIWGYVIAGVASIAIAGGVYWAIYHKGQTDANNATAGKTLAETEAERKAREANDAAAAGRSDADTLKCLRSPTGC